MIVISGPSGVGKDAIINALRLRRPDLHFVITATSRFVSACMQCFGVNRFQESRHHRPKRPGEVDGVDYHFVSKARFEEWLAQGQLLEHAIVYGDYKGIPQHQARGCRDSIDKQVNTFDAISKSVLQVVEALARGTDVVLRVDVQGAATIRRLISDTVSIFLVLPRA